MYLDVADFDHAREFFESYVAYYESRITQWQQRLDNVVNGRSPLIKARLASRDAEEHEAIVAYKQFALEGQIARARLEVQWAREGLEFVSRLESSRGRKRKSRPA